MYETIVVPSWVDIPAELRGDCMEQVSRGVFRHQAARLVFVVAGDANRREGRELLTVACTERGRYGHRTIDGPEVRRLRSSVLVTLNLDPVPGWGDDPSDHVRLLEDELARSVGHYRPKVTQVGGPLPMVPPSAPVAE